MSNPLEIQALSKTFGKKTALDSVSLSCQAGSIVGLIGPNGSGKSTLLRSAIGLSAPTSGTVRTFGCPALELESAQLSQIGFVQQESDLLDWLNVSDHLDYVASFYPKWDLERQNQLTTEFQIDPQNKVANLSVGDRQKLAIILAVCHHPKLLLLDEPASALDPQARRRLLTFLLEVARDDETAIIVSSHILVDIEKIIDHVWFLKDGRLVVDQDLDDLRENYAEWTVSASQGQPLPERFDESYIIEQKGDAHRRLLYVEAAESNLPDFKNRYSLPVQPRALNLEELYPLLVTQRPTTASHALVH